MSLHSQNDLILYPLKLELKITPSLQMLYSSFAHFASQSENVAAKIDPAALGVFPSMIDHLRI